MVGEVHADHRGLGDHRDLHELELLGAADAREHQQLRAVVRAAADDDLALGAVVGQLVEPQPLDADRARALEEELQRLHVRVDGEVRPVHRRVQV